MIYKTLPLFDQESNIFFVAIEPRDGLFDMVRHELDDNHEPSGEATVLETYRTVDAATDAAQHLQRWGEFKPRPMFTVRQTRRGDWLVSGAIQARYGIGIHKVGSPAPGYTTGGQFGRYATEAEAQVKAEALAEEHDGIVVEWQPPQQNRPFASLPRLYPTETNYNSVDDAEADGWIYISPSKTIEHYNGGVMFAQDITPGRAQGYELALVVKVQGQLQPRQFATNQIIWAGGKFSYRFRMGDVVDAITAARQYIDSLSA